MVTTMAWCHYNEVVSGKQINYLYVGNLYLKGGVVFFVIGGAKLRKS